MQHNTLNIHRHYTVAVAVVVVTVAAVDFQSITEKCDVLSFIQAKWPWWHSKDNQRLHFLT